MILVVLFDLFDFYLAFLFTFINGLFLFWKQPYARIYVYNREVKRMFRERDFQYTRHNTQCIESNSFLVREIREPAIFSHYLL